MASLMIGLPGEREEHVRETLAWVQLLSNERLAVFPVLYAPLDGAPAARSAPVVARALVVDQGLLSSELPLGPLDLCRQPGGCRRAAIEAGGVAIDGPRPNSPVEGPLRLACVEGRPVSMTPPADVDTLRLRGDLGNALDALCDRLVRTMHPEGFWEGRLSASALSTATAVSALSLANTGDDRMQIAAGVTWLVAHQNDDRGWGDTTQSPSNLATTLLAVAALKLAAGAGVGDPKTASATEGAQRYLAGQAAGNPHEIVAAMDREYGGDRTFAVPILMNLALAGLVSWTDIPDLPFELAVLPHGWYKALRLHVVSYALPALIAIGLIDRRYPSRNLLRRWIRRAITPSVLKKLAQIQPADGGFLEAIPLTSFVAMGLLPLFGCGPAGGPQTACGFCAIVAS